MAHGAQVVNFQTITTISGQRKHGDKIILRRIQSWTTIDFREATGRPLLTSTTHPLPRPNPHNITESGHIEPNPEEISSVRTVNGSDSVSAQLDTRWEALNALALAFLPVPGNFKSAEAMRSGVADAGTSSPTGGGSGPEKPTCDGTRRRRAFRPSQGLRFFMSLCYNTSPCIA